MVSTPRSSVDPKKGVTIATTPKDPKKGSKTHKRKRSDSDSDSESTDQPKTTQSVGAQGVGAHRVGAEGEYTVSQKMALVVI